MRNKLIFICGINKPRKGFEDRLDFSRAWHIQNRVYSIYGVSPTIVAGINGRLNIMVNKEEGMYQPGIVEKLNLDIKPIKYLSLFSGIGAFESALSNLGIPFEVTNYCEWDKYAAKAYALIHNIPENKNLGDITKVDETKLEDFDLMTFGWPCQDVSSAGKQKGFFDSDGNKTRSGLFYDSVRILRCKKPAIAIAENVKNLVSKRFKSTFELCLKELEESGYNVYYKVLNALDYGIPQSRERIFLVCVRKDLDNGKFVFPEPVKLEKKLKDMLEEVVDTKYFPKKMNPEHRKAIEKYIADNNYQGYPVGHNNYNFELNTRDISKCLDAHYSCGFDNRGQRTGVIDSYSIRKLTPKECFRLQGFKDMDVDVLMKNGLKDGRIYKMAGNSICVPVLEAIFKQLVKAELIK